MPLWKGEVWAVTGGSLWGTLLSEEVSFQVTGRRGPGPTPGFLQGSWPAEWKGGQGQGPQTCPQVTATRPCWVWVKRPGEQTCFLDRKLLGWATLVTASVREGSSSSLAAITIQLTFMLSLRTPALLTDPQPLANCVHKLNCKQLNVFQAATPSYEGRAQWSEQPPSPTQLRMGAMRDFQTAAGTASQPTDRVLQRAGDQIKLRSSTYRATRWLPTGQRLREEQLTRTAGSQGSFQKEFLLKWGQSYGISCWGGGPHILSRHSVLADAMVGTHGRGSTLETSESQEREEEWQSEKSTGSGSGLGSILVPSWITSAPSSICYLLWASVSPSIKTKITLLLLQFARLQWISEFIYEKRLAPITFRSCATW